MDALWKQRQAAKLRLAAQHADAIREALRKSVDVKKVVDEWINSHYTSNVTPEEARTWARIHVFVNSAPLNEVLKTLYSEGFVFGQDTALNALALEQANKAPTAQQLQNALSIPWSDWKPGNRAAAALIAPKGALTQLLNSRGITLAGIDNTTKDRIGTLLARGLKQGLPARDIAPQIADVLSPLRQQIADSLDIDIELMLSDSERAMMIAQTELTRAANVANRDMYLDSGVELVEWLTSDPCPECEENESVSPIGINDTFPSGDTEPPAHPNCVCTLAPYVLDTRDLGEDALNEILDEANLSANATLTKRGVTDRLDVERALARLEILPNPPEQDSVDPDKYAESPWRTVEPPTINPNWWDNAELKLVALQDLVATDLFLSRKKLKKHIEAMGQAVTPRRSYAMIVEINKELVIIDGHHRLMSLWLLGLDTAPVWLIKE